MKIHLSNILRIAKNQKDVDVNELRRLFTFENPIYSKTEALGYSTHGIPRQIKLVKDLNGFLELPRGVVGTLQGRYHIEIVDGSLTVPAGYPASKIELKPSQVEPVNALLSKNQGLLVGPPGFGKTICMIEAILRRRQKSLVLVHTRALLNQWTERLNGTNNVSVMTVQSLQKKLSKEFVNSFGLVVLDECHHAPAYTFRTLLSQFPARYRYGLTATPEREDGLSFLLHAVIGPIIYEVKKSDLLSNGEIIKPKIRMIETNFYRPTIQDYGTLLAAVTEDPDRNSLILKYVKDEAEKGHCCLVLSERISHVEALGEQFRGISSVPCAAITSKSPKQTREQALAALNAGAIKVLFSTRIADEGLDLPQLDRLFLTCPVRSVNKVTQQVGRIQRKFPGKKDATVFDFVDSLVGLARSQARTRRPQAYRGYEIHEN
jgi:superfamily II DNA or RNA helicase